MLGIKLTQTIIEINVLGRSYKLSILKILAIMFLAFVVSAFTFCSCCTYTLTDVIDIAFEKFMNLINGSTEMSVRVKTIKEKTCDCDSPWYSPCVVWGNKEIKEQSCNSKGSCERKSNVQGAVESDTQERSIIKDSSKECDKANCEDCPARLDDAGQPNNVVDPFYNRGGNRTLF